MPIDAIDTHPSRYALSKVPELTVYFWIIKIFATTVGETAADYVNITLGLGLQSTTMEILSRPVDERFSGGLLGA